VFEVMARKGALKTQQVELRARFAEALAAYQTKQWETAPTARAWVLWR
jgi:hypothetical protein